MPLTISHAAAALPLHRLGKSRLPLAALMIGGMVPDFAYFVPNAPSRLATHSIAGLFWFCWPVGLAAWWLFVRWLEAPTLALLPDRWRLAFVPSNRNMNLETLGYASAAVIVGALSHFMWDAFTHWSSPLVQAVPFLKAPALEIGGLQLRVYRVLQYLSSIVGVVVLLIWVARRGKTQQRRPRAHRQPRFPMPLALPPC